MTKGFITIATGDKQYYKIAANLLLSYRCFSESPCPFAIIADEENEYTALFDDVIITNEAKRSFLDKFLILKLCPYDETIFLDADCLAYGDLNKYWEFFKDATDFSAVGSNFDLSDNNGAWYNLDGIGEYGKLIKYKTKIHAGVMFVRNTNKLEKLYRDYMEMCDSFDTLYFHTCPFSIDECVLGVALPLNNMKAVEENPQLIASYPALTTLKVDMMKRELQYSTPWHDTVNGILLHWGTAQTRQPLYKFNVECLEYLVSEKKTFLNEVKYQLKFRLLALRIKNLPSEITLLMKRIKNKCLGAKRG